jgi:alkylation response protein AidB-like acyl-CoA dehydrogenase|tara:strand:+ start:536 stop:1714 length:1179 start_codon:yes stop_codon:yes gene_type:complete
VTATSKTIQQPKDFGFDADALALKDVAEKFFQDNLPTQKLHALVAHDSNLEHGTVSRWDADLWQQIVDLGWLMVSVPERVGGMGMSAVAVATLVEQAGRAALPGPLVPTLNVSYILGACGTDNADAALSLICEGSTFSYAACNKSGSWEHDTSDLVIEGGKLTGEVHFVQDAQKVDYFLVNAKLVNDNQGVDTTLVAVPANAEGLSIMPNAIIDLTRDQARLQFDQTPIENQQIVSAPGKALEALRLATPALLVTISADICGAAEWQLQTTAEYARTRKQFDRNIGFFQAVKHPLADFMIAIDLARSHLYNAACAIDFEPEKAEQFARMAKAAASDAAAFGSKKSVQLHGGIGFTWECFVHIYMKRQLHSQTLLGDASHQRAKLAELILSQS